MNLDNSFVDFYASHIPVLGAIAKAYGNSQASGGPAESFALECGCGFYSTPILAGIFDSLVVYETLPDWFAVIQEFAPTANVVYQEGPPPDMTSGRADLVFIDGTVEQRLPWTLWAVKNANVVIHHDTDDERLFGPCVEAMKDHASECYHYAPQRFTGANPAGSVFPHTTISLHPGGDDSALKLAYVAEALRDLGAWEI